MPVPCIALDGFASYPLYLFSVLTAFCSKAKFDLSQRPLAVIVHTPT